MADQFIGEIRMFAGNFAPTGWAFCNGQLVAISQNTALFSLLGTTYGGDGKTTFALPDLRGRTPLHFGQGPGLSSYPQGQSAGENSHTLQASEMPAHTHLPQADPAPGSLADPSGAAWGSSGRGRPLPYGAPPNTAMSLLAVGPSGGSQPHNNMQPYLAVSFIIALQGIFPPRS